MSAYDYGFSEGRCFLDNCEEEILISAYRTTGKRRSEQYVRSDRKLAYYAGWCRAAGLDVQQEDGQEQGSEEKS